MPRLFRRLCRVWEAIISEPPEFDEGGMRTLAGAICCLAAGAHTKDSGEQQQMAAIFYEASRSGFYGIPANQMMEAFVASMIQSATKKSK